ncbi:MAG: ATP-grasp domain-containing protein [Elusimicrobiota bacterium]|nr:ATP-grasp domain-containing protein [Endomicrobiia bacterium]MDW8166728.1 ATP-grasp domain-containing protein [Elusimicrobiota bacterium]
MSKRDFSYGNDKWIVRSAVCSLASYGWLKILKDMGFKLFGVDVVEWCRYNDLLDGFAKVVKAVEENEDELISQLLSITKNINPYWIISGPETEVYLLVKYENVFEQFGVSIFHPPIETMEIIKNKYKLASFCNNRLDSFKNFKVPTTELLSTFVENSEANISEIFNKTSNKKNFIIKPIEGRGSTGITRVDANKVYKIIEREEYKDLSKFLIQEFIEGEEVSVDVLYDFKGIPLNIIPRKRLAVDSGISIVTETFYDNKIVEIVKELSSELKFRGMNNIQFIKRNNDYYLTDINPRFGGASIICYFVSESFKRNLFNILNKNFEDLVQDFTPPKKVRMIRYYVDFYYEV